MLIGPAHCTLNTLSELWGFVWYILPGPEGDAALRAEVQAVEALSEVHAALAAYHRVRTTGSSNAGAQFPDDVITTPASRRPE